jgi:hypothetical protein
MTLFEKKEKLSAALKIRNRISKLEDALSDYMRSGGVGAAVLHSAARLLTQRHSHECTGFLLDEVESSIRSVARRGATTAYIYRLLTKSAIKILEELGYKVTSYFDRNELYYAIEWQTESEAG